MASRAAGKPKITSTWPSKSISSCEKYPDGTLSRCSSDLQAKNDDTADKIYENRTQVNAHRRWLLQDGAGIAPRMLHFDMDSVSLTGRLRVSTATRFELL